MKNRTKLKLKAVEKMVSSLNLAIDLVSENIEQKYEDGLKDSVIQRFEYSIEGIQKLLKYVLLEKYGEDTVSPKESIKVAYKVGMLKDMKIFLDMIDKRNRLSHDYHEEFANISFGQIVNNYIDPINEVVSFIKKELG